MKTEPNELAGDLLEGAADIAQFVFGDAKQRRKVYHLASIGQGAQKLPCFRMGNILYARKSTLMSWIANLEKAGA
jgi:hypothetical protein